MSTEAAPSSSTSSDRDNNFKVLASGTQDLAALVGIFAADSVEPYAFNYSRGWLSPLGATLSLLGLLGYIRGLVKLALGREGCLRAKFNIDAERTFFGFLDQDWLPPVPSTRSHIYDGRGMPIMSSGRHTEGSNILQRACPFFAWHCLALPQLTQISWSTHVS